MQSDENSQTTTKRFGVGGNIGKRIRSVSKKRNDTHAILRIQTTFPNPRIGRTKKIYRLSIRAIRRPPPPEVVKKILDLALKHLGGDAIA